MAKTAKKLTAKKAEKRAKSNANLVLFKPGQSGNPAGMKPGTIQVGAKIRQAFMNVIIKREKGKKDSLEKVLDNELENAPLATLSAVSKFLPKEIDVGGKVEHNHSVKHTGVQETRRWVRELLGRGDEGHDSESLPN